MKGELQLLSCNLILLWKTHILYYFAQWRFICIYLHIYHFVFNYFLFIFVLCLFCFFVWVRVLLHSLAWPPTWDPPASSAGLTGMHQHVQLIFLEP
jgi:hypothetical protein